MVKKNDLFTIEITDLGNKGEGIGKAEGYTLFVDNALPGDQCLVKILKSKKSYGYAKIEKIVAPSPYRVEPPCPIWNKCGGCAYLHMDYDAALQFKHKKVWDSMARIGGFKDAGQVIRPIIQMEAPFHYRNKVQLPVGKNGNKAIAGYYAKSSHRIIPQDNCCIHPAKTAEIMDIILNHMDEYAILPYDEKSNSGLVRHILIRYGFATGDIMVCLIINEKKGGALPINEKKGGALPFEEALLEQLKGIKGIKSILLNYNSKKTNVIMGQESRLLWGQAYINDFIGAIKFRISPLSFYQVNSIQTKKLYDLVINMGMLKKDDIVLDAYCGIGSIALYIAGHVSQVYGIEIIEQAVQDARENARINNINNVHFETGKAETAIHGLEKKGYRPTVIIVDPPRKGCEAPLLDAVANIGPERFIYVSCNPDTLARDLRIIADQGYILAQLQPIDMFPHTTHVETVAVMKRADC